MAKKGRLSQAAAASSEAFRRRHGSTTRFEEQRGDVAYQRGSDDQREDRAGNEDDPIPTGIASLRSSIVRTARYSEYKKYDVIQGPRSQFRVRLVLLTLPIAIILLSAYQYLGQGLAANETASEHGELYLPPLQAGQVMQLMRRDGNPASEYGSRVGLPPELRGKILSHCDEVGMIDLARMLMETPLQTDLEKVITLKNGERWNAYRPPKKWHSNMHWMKPQDDATQQSFLKVLGDAGLGQVFDAVGKYFNLDGIYVHLIAIIAVSQAYGKSYLHYDFTETGGKGFNIIIPLINVDGSPPELYVQDESDEETLHAIKYNHDTAFVTGDDVMHKTAPVDYNIANGEMRVSVTIYCSDINEDNVDVFLEDTTPFEPEDTRETLLDKSGLHWSPIEGDRLPR